MALMREFLSLLALVGAITAALPALIVVAPLFTNLCRTVLLSGLTSAASTDAAMQLCSANYQPAVWLLLSAVLLANFMLVKIWSAMAKL